MAQKMPQLEDMAYWCFKSSQPKPLTDYSDSWHKGIACIAKIAEKYEKLP